MKLTRFERFVMMLQSSNLEEARKICGEDLVLRHALLLLTIDYDFNW